MGGGKIIYDDFRKVDLCFLEKDGYVIELVSPKGDSMANLIKRLGNSPYHICYMVTNIAHTSEELVSKGFVMCDAPHEAVALENKKVCFFIHPYMGMIELLEGGPQR